MPEHAENKKIIVRFPPSPTGPFHMGSVRTALYNFLFAKKNNGLFLLRIEDTDRERSTPEFEKNIFDSLSWLGLRHDGEVLKSSERTDIYKARIHELIQSGKAYISQETEGKNKEVVRFRNPGGTVVFSDLIRGEVKMDVSDLGDFIIARNTDDPLYHLAVTVDDVDSGVTHIIRGEDHISNTPRQILLVEALGGKRPIYAHLPLVLAPDRSKLSKRKHGRSVSLDFYREQGYLPEAIINFMALIGWSPGDDREIFSLDELIGVFDISHVQKGGAIFNKDKLDWINKEYMRKMAEDARNKEIAARVATHPEFAGNPLLTDQSFMIKLCPVIFDRISKWSDVDTMIGEGELSYFFEKPTYESARLSWKGECSPDEIRTHLSHAVEIFERAAEEHFESPEKIKSLIFDYATEKGRGQVLWPIRVALSGKDKSPDPFTLMHILGRQESVDRLKKAIASVQ